jgi:hypothetical protein
MTDLDHLLRAADPAARLTAPAPGVPPLDRPVPARPPRRAVRWVPAVAAAAAVLLVVGAVTTGLGRDRSAGPAGTAITSSPAPPQVTAPAAATAAADQARARRVLADLRAAVPRTFAVPTGKVRVDPHGPPEIAWDVQALSFPAEPVTTMRYQVLQDVTAGRGIGQLTATVIPGVPAWTDDPCALFQRMHLGLYDGCDQVVTPTGDRVAVGDWGRSEGPIGVRFASHRRADGTFVLLTEARGILPGAPALAALPLTDGQLTALVTDPAFGR